MVKLTDEWLARRDKFDERRDTHDYFDKDHVARFLRNDGTGVDNVGRFGLAHIVSRYENPTVLDAACGTAVNYQVFKNHKVKCKYIAYDRTQQFLDYAKSLYGDEIEYVRGYAQDLPYADNEVDITILRHVLEHMEPTFAYDAIKEAIRVSSKEAVLVFFLMPTGSAAHQIEYRGPDERNAYHWWNTYSWPSLVRYFTDFQVKMDVKHIKTPNAAHPDLIVRLIKC